MNAQLLLLCSNMTQTLAMIHCLFYFIFLPILLFLISFSAPVRSSMPVPVSVMSIFNLAAKTKDTGKEAEDTGSFSSFSALLKK